MKRLFIVKICALIMLFHEVAPAQSRSLLAEGDCIAHTTSGVRPLSHWKLWRLDSGKYEVIDTSVLNPSFIQVFRFDSKFLPIGFSKKSGPVELPDPRFPKLPGSEISCEYNTDKLTCKGISGDGAESTQTAAGVPPYVALGEFYDLDFAWFMTGVVHLASRGTAKDGFVNVYAITGKKPREIALKLDKPIQIVFDGDESGLVLGRMQKIKKYRMKSDNGRILLGTDQGLIVGVNNASHPEVGFAIENYKEYEPWGVPFGEIPRAGASHSASIAPVGPARVEVPSGVMIGLLVDRVSPEYPADAKLNKVQGKVILHAVISKEGRVIEANPISGPQELVSAAVNAVKAWQYRPYVSQGQPVEVDTSIVLDFSLPK